MARNDPQMNLRVPMELKENIEKAALDNGRTITAEAVYRLEQSFEEHKPSEFDKEFVLQVIKSQESTITDLTDQIKHLKMSFDVLTKELHAKKNRI